MTFLLRRIHHQLKTLNYFAKIHPFIKESASSISSHCQDAPNQQIAQNGEPDKLYKMINVEVRGYEPMTLKSFGWFAVTAAEELGITVSKVWEPPKIHQRHTLLKSVFVHSKHRVQYEIRTYFRVIQLKYLTGSTADTYLEYIQRNLPEGVGMKVTKHSIERIPDHIKRPKQETHNRNEEVKDNSKKNEV